MANDQQQPQQQQQDPTTKNIGFALIPIAPTLLVAFLGLQQTGSLSKATSAQNAVASTSEVVSTIPKGTLKACYKQLGVDRNVDALTDDQAAKFLDKCRQDLEKRKAS